MNKKLVSDYLISSCGAVLLDLLPSQPLRPKVVANLVQAISSKTCLSAYWKCIHHPDRFVPDLILCDKLYCMLTSHFLLEFSISSNRLLIKFFTSAL